MTDRRARQRTDDLPWVETTARVIASNFNHSTWGEGGKNQSDNLSYFITKFSYRVGGVVYHGELRSREVRVLGSKFSIRYDPSNPQYNSIAESEKEIGSRLLFWILIATGVLLFVFIFRYLL